MSNTNEMMQDILYMQSLQPDEECEVDFAVGTTYSVSMEGLVAVPLALSKIGEPKAMTDRTALYMMEGIRRAADKFVVFCNKGSILVPRSSQPLYSLLENSVVEVAEPTNPLANFHPKLWVSREISKDGDHWIKLIITSRNLAFSTDLDAAVVIRGRVLSGASNTKNRPLAEMLRILAERYDCNTARQRQINRLADDLENVSSFDFESPMSDKVYEFHPMILEPSGKSRFLNINPLKNRILGKRVLVMSPFIDTALDTSFLREIKEASDELFLVTNDNNVTDELYEMLPEHIYTANPLLSEDEDAHVRLHAKIYLVEQSNGMLYLYVGSANATHNGFARNGELMIGMRINRGSFDDVFKELVEKDGLYIPIDGATADATEEAERRTTENATEHILRWAINSMTKATIVKKRGNEDAPYEVSVHIRFVDMRPYFIDAIVDKYAVSVRPLQTKNDWRELRQGALSWQLCLDELSEFYVVEVTDIATHNIKRSRICKVATDGLDRFRVPRDKQIVNSILKEDNIMQYLDMLLSEMPEYTFEKWEKRRLQGRTPSAHNNALDSVAIYEKLLKASYESPERVSELKEIVDKLSSNQSVEELKAVLSAFGIKFRSKKR